jgi:hypothetical protein
MLVGVAQWGVVVLGGRCGELVGRRTVATTFGTRLLGPILRGLIPVVAIFWLFFHRSSLPGSGGG